MIVPAVELGMSFNLISHSVYIPIKPFWLYEVSLNASCNAGRTVNCLSDVYPSKFCLKQEVVSAPLLVKCAYVYTISDLQANQKRFKVEWDGLDCGLC
jgi:hypothetical protein